MEEKAEKKNEKKRLRDEVFECQVLVRYTNSSYFHQQEEVIDKIQSRINAIFKLSGMPKLLSIDINVRRVKA